MGLGKVLVKRSKRWFRKNKNDIRVCDEDEEAKCLQEITLAAIAENAQQHSSIPALNRQSSAGGTPIMPSGPADVPCAGLGIDAMLEEIDDSATPGISHKLEEEQRNRENRLSEVILSVVAENGGQDSSIPALMQQSSASVPSGLADFPFADLDIDAVLKEFNDSVTPGISHNLEYEQTKEANRLPDGTLSAFIETGQPESSIPVLKQRSYTGNKRVIPSALANLSCADLGVDAVFEKLNAILGKSAKLTSDIRSVPEPYIARHDDFGTVYAHLYWYWAGFSKSDIGHRLRRDEREAQEKERNLLINGRIKTLHAGCRRAWDLYANRVVPSWSGYTPLGISHAWVDERDRVNVWSPINGYEWPVPIPRDANLDLIRIEMLNLGAHYVWLDVLCLRQEGGLSEDLRVQEWKIDVPTIGSVYALGRPVVCYFCGLGLPLRLKPGYFTDDRCWFKRAWTLQEIREDMDIGGETGDEGTFEEDIQK